jgi:hypothetical protein
MAKPIRHSLTKFLPLWQCDSKFLSSFFNFGVDMPATFTHQFICGEALNKVSSYELRQLLNSSSNFVYLGSESPDLPYLSLGGQTNWADLMHYERTNSLVINGFEELHQRWSLGPSESDKVELAWLFGYVSHMVADVAIHPIINSIVGPYVLHSHEHRICEMTMDSLLFHELSGSELEYSGWIKHMDSCQAHTKEFEDLMDFWKDILLKAYPERAGDDLSPSSWFTTYTTALGVAEGDHGIMAIFRHLGLNDYFYQTSVDIMENNPEYIRDYYDQVKLPGGRIGSFYENGFNFAISHVVEEWEKLFHNFISLELNWAELIKNWDLDIGIDIDNAPLYFWT